MIGLKGTLNVRIVVSVILSIVRKRIVPYRSLIIQEHS